ncbi:MAG: YbhB/YbcL family Raf kinase inhibitor-like protein, partial [Patescibacteria group bacterium]
VAVYALQSKEQPNKVDIIEAKPNMSLSITSPAFEHNGRIPPKYTCDGGSISPSLAFSGTPENARSLALIMDDPDVPRVLRPDGVFDHWVLFNILPATAGIGEGKSAGTAGANGAGKNAYTEPCPPPQYEPKEHRYVFTLYALDTTLALKDGAAKQEVLKAMEGHVIEQAELIGRYSRE